MGTGFINYDQCIQLMYLMTALSMLIWSGFANKTRKSDMPFTIMLVSVFISQTFWFVTLITRANYLYANAETLKEIIAGPAMIVYYVCINAATINLCKEIAKVSLLYQEKVDKLQDAEDKRNERIAIAKKLRWYEDRMYALEKYLPDDRKLWIDGSTTARLIDPKNPFPNSYRLGTFDQAEHNEAPEFCQFIGGPYSFRTLFVDTKQEMWTIASAYEAQHSRLKEDTYRREKNSRGEYYYVFTGEG